MSIQRRTILGLILTLGLTACGGDSIRELPGQPLCGSSSIRGSQIGSIEGTLPGCGLRSGVSVTSVAGVRLSSPARMDCTTAKALDRWVRKGVKPAVGRTGGGVDSLAVWASYSCRTRNNIPGAKISQHGRGKAIDIGGFRLMDGSSISVLSGWQDRSDRRILKKMHRAACGPFKTVLGPEADRYHTNHFHMDTGRHSGGGTYCR